MAKCKRIGEFDLFSSGKIFINAYEDYEGEKTIVLNYKTENMSFKIGFRSLIEIIKFLTESEKRVYGLTDDQITEELQNIRSSREVEYFD